MHTKAFLTEPVSKLFFRYLIPSICGTMVTSIYVLADTIIIGKGIGIHAMAALNIILPLFNIFFGTGLLFGVGGSVLMSICRGKGEIQKGHSYFSTAFLLNVVTCILYMVLFISFKKETAVFLGATSTTLPYVMDYMPYILWGLSAFSFSSFLQTFIRNDGAPKLSMIAVMSGGILNVILDLFFVFTLKMEMAGAALASVCGSVLTVSILSTHFFSRSNSLRFSFKDFSSHFITDIYKTGTTSFLVEISSGIVMFVFNLQLLKYVGDIGVSMYGVITNTAIVVMCLCNGINQASQPILSTNYGAGLYNRTNHIKRLGIQTAIVICSLPAILGLVMPDMFTYIFLNPSEKILTLSGPAIRIYFTAFFITGINMFIVGYFQSIIKPHISLFLCLLRGCILSIVFVYILPPVIGVNGIWISVPLAEFITLFLGMLFLKKTHLEVKQ